jgi:hypothetical protein
VPPGFPGFAIFGSLALLKNFFFLDPLALRRQISLVLPFIVCNLILARAAAKFKYF